MDRLAGVSGGRSVNVPISAVLDASVTLAKVKARRWGWRLLAQRRPVPESQRARAVASLTNGKRNRHLVVFRSDLLVSSAFFLQNHSFSLPHTCTPFSSKGL